MLPGPPIKVLGVKLGFSVFGAGASLALRNSPQPADIELVARLHKSIRHEPETLETSLGVIRGELWLQGNPAEVVFRCDPASLVALSQSAEPTDETSEVPSTNLPRALDLVLPAPAFCGLSADQAKPQLLLPEQTHDYSYLEVVAELRIAGSVEATRDQNDVLDVPIWRDAPGTARAFSVLLVDEVGEPLQDVAVTFTIGGTSVARTTDAEGRVQVLAGSSEKASLGFDDETALRDLLVERWTEVRDRPLVPTDPEQGDLAVRLDPQPLPTVDCEAGQLQRVVFQPGVIHAQVWGMWFDTSKCFLLPTALDGIRFLVDLYKTADPSDLLVVGHTDTAGNPSYNDPLSLERAKAVVAYLTDQVTDWLAWYGSGKPAEKRWGEPEDTMMIVAVARATGGVIPPDQTPLAWYRESRNLLPVDAKADGALRESLVTEYMDIDNTSLPTGIRVSSHGCGENYPAQPTGDDEHCLPNRRVDMFFFSHNYPGEAPPSSILPAPDSPSSPEYPEWLRRANPSLTFGEDLRIYRVQLHDELRQYTKNCPYQLLLPSGDVLWGTTDESGWLEVVAASTQHQVEATFRPQTEDPQMVRQIWLTGAEPDTDEAYLCHIRSFGFNRDDVDEHSLFDFQLAKKLPLSGVLDDETKAAVDQILTGGNDSLQEQL